MNPTTYVTPAEAQMHLTIVIFIYAVVVLVAYMVTSWLMAGVFWKAGEERWKAWIPFYNNWVFFRIGDQHPALLFLAFIPVVGGLLVAIFAILAAYNIGRHLAHGGGWVAMYIFLPVVWLAVFAFDSSMWHDNDELSYPTGRRTVAIGKEIPRGAYR